ncbi:orotidine 5'-phosphate decarboxylase / HUMPS family protein [Neobacillus sp. YIM B06451]|uniref:orotidine 5'-phosphate decarboxylase / HUMPS family protein n=1 Tax=Neobacillus sp. YIM B06451 TaxID=3070994 RepID=UPI00292CD94F|nr:orotidine 5'-phosphate decarboxylase / HUMPS family protein [Neobacillus sp. YIM B06451]
MKLQLAVDRVSIERAIEIIREAEQYIDIIEIGTSLIKDFGLESVKRIRAEFPDKAILADIKTVDEAEYEFEAIYRAGADIATVLGAASFETIRICQKVAQKHQKDYMIDLLETSPEKQLELKQFSDGILCVHLPSDKSTGLQALIKSTLAQIHDFPRLAVAGGIKPENIAEIKKANFEIAIVGSSITKSASIRESAKLFKSLVGGEE